mmetsp:Transcript_35158/g.54844  ORF Transcript_35158/g.54844 Transcript_35158/m.54844 type:complete len:210 (-) Transcript_35158:175-804(-)
MICGSRLSFSYESSRMLLSVTRISFCACEICFRKHSFFSSSAKSLSTSECLFLRSNSSDLSSSFRFLISVFRSEIAFISQRYSSSPFTRKASVESSCSIISTRCLCLASEYPVFSCTSSKSFSVSSICLSTELISLLSLVIRFSSAEIENFSSWISFSFLWISSVASCDAIAQRASPLFFVGLFMRALSRSSKISAISVSSSLFCLCSF